MSSKMVQFTGPELFGPGILAKISKALRKADPDMDHGRSMTLAKLCTERRVIFVAKDEGLAKELVKALNELDCRAREYAGPV